MPSLARRSVSPRREQPPPPAPYRLQSESQDDPIWTPRTRTRVSPIEERWNISDSLQPSRLLSKGARSGHFSLQNVLSIPNLLTSDSTTNSESQSKASRVSSDTDDPIFCNLVSYPVALGLFEKYVKSPGHTYISCHYVLIDRK